MKDNKMKAMVAKGYGSPEVFSLESVSKPRPGKKEVLVKIYTSSATTADTMMRTGKPFFARFMLGLRKPKHPIPGTGFAGVVEEVGSEVTNYATGDRVFGETTTGFSTNAEYVAVPENGVIVPVPETMSFIEAASFCDGPVTSYNFLKEIGEIRKGQEILVIGASGSLGTAAIQLAKYFGAVVTGVCSTRNVGLVKSLGADKVIDYTREDYATKEDRYDIVYDTIGKSSFQKVRNILKPEGQYLSPVLQIRLLWQMIRTSKSGGKKAKFAATGLKNDDELRTMLKRVVDIFMEGKLKMTIDRQYPLEKLAEAHRYIDTGRKKGNVVISNS